MPSTDDLSSHISADDYKGFLRTYFQLIDGGQNLSLPSSLELSGIREGWSEILPGIAGGYTDEFLDGLSQFWAQIVKKQGGTIGDNFAKQILALIDGQPMPAMATASATESEPKPQSTGGAPSNPSSSSSAPTNAPSSSSSDSSNPTVESQISQNYYHFQAAAEFRIPDGKKIQQLLKTAIESEDALAFLVYHMANSPKTAKPNLPMSSVIFTIQQKWEDILMEDYSIQPEPTFVKAVASQWFGVVNLKGLPASKEKTDEIFNHLVQALQKKEAESKPKVASKPSTGPRQTLPNPILTKIKSIFKK